MKFWQALAIITLCLSIGYFSARAQAPASAYTVGVIADHTKCALSTTQAGYCFATDGIWRQIAGDAAPMRIDVPIVAGVTSFNGKTGAVTSPTAGILYSDLGGTPPVDAVTSVNGKKGAVVLSVQ